MNKMEIERRIKSLSKVVSGIDIKELNRIYIEDEVNFVLENFKNYPEVKYSDEMKNRIIKEAESKKITKSEQKYILQLKELNESFLYKTYIESIENQVQIFFRLLKNNIKNSELVKVVHIELDYSPNCNYNYCHLYFEEEKFDYSNELGLFVTKFNFKKIWGFLYLAKHENIGHLLIEEEEGKTFLGSVFDELYKLRSYNLIKMIINRKKYISIIENELNLKSMRIEIGEHDCEFHTIFEN